MAADGVYTAPTTGAAGVELRVVLRAGEQDAALLGVGISRPSVLADVRVTELAQPAEGGTLAVGAESFRVRTFRKDAERVVWQLDLEPG